MPDHKEQYPIDFSGEKTLPGSVEQNYKKLYAECIQAMSPEDKTDIEKIKSLADILLLLGKKAVETTEIERKYIAKYLPQWRMVVDCLNEADMVKKSIFDSIMRHDKSIGKLPALFFCLNRYKLLSQVNVENLLTCVEQHGHELTHRLQDRLQAIQNPTITEVENTITSLSVNQPARTAGWARFFCWTPQNIKVHPEKTALDQSTISRSSTH